MRKGNPDMEACDSMEKGVITMYNKIISGINSEYDILLEEMCIRDRLYNVLYTEICGFKPFSWQKSRIFFVAMT